jgi:hypothetical protein
MRPAAAAAALFLFAAAATPAQATQGIFCRANARPNLRLDLVIGSNVSSVVAQARLSDGSTVHRTGGAGPTIGQAWIDEHALHLDLVDASGTRHLARLRTWRQSGRGAYAGSLRYAGRQYQVRCRGE